VQSGLLEKVTTHPSCFPATLHLTPRNAINNDRRTTEQAHNGAFRLLSNNSGVKPWAIP